MRAYFNYEGEEKLVSSISWDMFENRISYVSFQHGDNHLVIHNESEKYKSDTYTYDDLDNKVYWKEK